MAYLSGWSRCTGAKIKSVAPAAQPYYDFNYYVGGIITSWGTGALDIRRNRWITGGAGGDSDSSNNEAYSLSLDSPSTFVRLTDPSTWPPQNIVDLWMADDGVDGKGQPLSRHVYNGMVYLSHVDKIFAPGGLGPTFSAWSKDHVLYGAHAAYGRSCSGNRQQWIFNCDVNYWSPHTAYPLQGYLGQASQIPDYMQLYPMVSYDPYSRLVFQHLTSGNLPSYLYAYSFDATTSLGLVNTWKLLSTTLSFRGSAYDSTCIDPVRRKLIIICAGNSGGVTPFYPPGSCVKIVDLTTYTLDAQLTTWGDLTLESSSRPGYSVPRGSLGLCYHPPTGLILAWEGADAVPGNARDVYTLNIVTGEWKKYTWPTGPVKNSASVATWGHFQWSPRLNASVGITSVSEDAWINRLDTTPPTAGAQAPCGWIDIPLRVWNTRAVGVVGPFQYETKHMSLELSQLDGKIYAMGGDVGGSGSNRLYKYDLVTDTWTLIHGQCRTDYHLQPDGADQIPFLWDPLQNKFWMLFGETMGNSASVLCGGASSQQKFQYQVPHLSFNPNTGDWSREKSICTCDSYQTGADTPLVIDATNVAVAQSFQATNYGRIFIATVTLSKSAGATGSITPKLYAHSGTYGTTSVPGALKDTAREFWTTDGNAYRRNIPLDVATYLTTTPTQFTFLFHAGSLDPIGTQYVLSVEGANIVGSVYVTADCSTPSHSGNVSTKIGSVWYPDDTKDMLFEVFLATPANLYRAVLDPQTYAIYFVGENAKVYKLDLTTGIWSFKITVPDQVTVPAGNSIAIDVVGRRIWWINPTTQKLYTYNIDSNTLDTPITLPISAGDYAMSQDPEQLLAWDMINGVLFWAYHPLTCGEYPKLSQTGSFAAGAALTLYDNGSPVGTGNFYGYHGTAILVRNLSDPHFAVYSGLNLSHTYEWRDGLGNTFSFPPIDATSGDFINLYVFTPTTPGNGTWYHEDGASVGGFYIAGRHMTFDYYHNALLIAGPKFAVTGNPMFLYRFGDGTGAGNIPPLPPQNLRVA